MGHRAMYFDRCSIDDSSGSHMHNYFDRQFRRISLDRISGNSLIPSAFSLSTLTKHPIANMAVGLGVVVLVFAIPVALMSIIFLIVGPSGEISPDSNLFTWLLRTALISFFLIAWPFVFASAIRSFRRERAMALLQAMERQNESLFAEMDAEFDSFLRARPEAA
jgi:hypothetical protein